MIEGKPLFYKCWLENNIIRVEDLFDNNGNFLSFNHFSEQYQLKTLHPLFWINQLHPFPMEIRNSKTKNFSANSKRQKQI